MPVPRCYQDATAAFQNAHTIFVCGEQSTHHTLHAIHYISFWDMSSVEEETADREEQ